MSANFGAECSGVPQPGFQCTSRSSPAVASDFADQGRGVSTRTETVAPPREDTITGEERDRTGSRKEPGSTSLRNATLRAQVEELRRSVAAQGKTTSRQQVEHEGLQEQGHHLERALAELYGEMNTNLAKSHDEMLQRMVTQQEVCNLQEQVQLEVRTELSSLRVKMEKKSHCMAKQSEIGILQEQPKRAQQELQQIQLKVQTELASLCAQLGKLQKHTWCHGHGAAGHSGDGQAPRIAGEKASKC